MPRQIVVIDPAFGRRLKELREKRGLSLRRLGQQVHCSHGYLWELEVGGKRPSTSVVALLDAALGASGELSALVSEASADNGGLVADATSAPQWIGYFDEAYLSAKFGHCFAALGRGKVAARFAARSLEMDGDTYARGRQFNLALLALAHAQAGDPEQASTVGVQAVLAAESLSSERARAYLAAIADRLAPYSGLSAVLEFSARARPLLQPV